MVRTYWLVPVFYEASGHLDLQPFARIDHVEACRPRAMSLTIVRCPCDRGASKRAYLVLRAASEAEPGVIAERASVHIWFFAPRAKRSPS